MKITRKKQFTKILKKKQSIYHLVYNIEVSGLNNINVFF